MSALDDMKRRLRDRSEHYLMLASVKELGSGVPGTVSPYRERGGLLWRWLFVPLYRRVPWAVKARAMKALRMTASGFTPPARRPGEPWRPPRDKRQQ
jgi:hypothetical protein